MSITVLLDSIQMEIIGIYLINYMAYKIPANTAVTPGGANGAVQFNNAGTFGGDATNFFWDNTNKRLGIGIAAPTSSLQVSSEIDVIGATSAAFFYGNQGAAGELTAGTSIGIFSGKAGNLTFYPESAGAAGSKVAIDYHDGANWREALSVANTGGGLGSLILMKSGGKVGIGKTSPTGIFDVLGKVGGTGLPGDLILLTTGQGGPVDGAGGNAGNGGAFGVVMGAGGAADVVAGSAGIGGAFSVTGGTGGTGSAALISGPGGSITFTAGAPGASGGAGASVGGATTFFIADNKSTAFSITQSGNVYLNVSTVDSNEAILFGNGVTNPVFTFSGTGNIGMAGGGSLSVGSSMPNAVALVDLTSSTKGFLPPRMTTAQRTAIAAVEGLVVYDTTIHGLFVYDSANWIQL